MFQRVGPKAFKKDLTNTIKLLEHLGNPQNNFKSVHIAGTNGKGSSANMICSVLMEAGFKVGLYTSPHLRSFTERIRVNGREIGEKEVIDFVLRNREFLLTLKPSFFEMTVAMAFNHFSSEQVDWAVVEVGLGGRLDSTNVLDPEICLITSIGMDHQEFLGDTLPEIAGEKAGIIKSQIPVVISENQPEIFHVFEQMAGEKNAPLTRAWEAKWNGLVKHEEVEDFRSKLTEVLPLQGEHQQRNLLGAIAVLNELADQYKIGSDHAIEGIRNLIRNTGFQGRWSILREQPFVVCDCAHNEDGLKNILPQILELPGKLHVVWGTVDDKDIAKNLSLMPEEARYFYCQPDIPRKMDSDKLAKLGNGLGRKGEDCGSVNEAFEMALRSAEARDSVFVGGSIFVVAEVI